MYPFLRRLLFCLPPECSHHLALLALKIFYGKSRVLRLQKHFPQKPTKVFGLTFPNPIGLAAGLDKDGVCIDAWYGLGFGFIEVGAVTPKAQPGNPKPRLFRLPKANALINRFGFNNQGVDAMVLRLQQRKIGGILGVNLGKNATTPLEEAVQDYSYCYKKVYPFVDFVTINISSPNTLNLRLLQSTEYLLQLLTELKQLQQQFKRYVPLLVKVSPDLTADEIQQMAEIFLQVKVDGIIAVNTTLDRSAVKNLPSSKETGGLSGKPLLVKARFTIAEFHRATKGEIPIIGVGGIFSAQDAKELLAAGASLLQIYTGLIYQGPGLIQQILKEI